MEKIAIVGFHNLHLMQFLYKYTDILDANGIEYDVLYWDRDLNSSIKYKPFDGQKITFSYKMSNYQPKYKKILGFVKCLSFMCKTLRKNKYFKVILLTTQTALPLYLLSAVIRKKAQYVYDYRDLTYEKIPICKKLILKMIDRSEFTAISSLGFKQVLGDRSKFVMSHNVSQLAYKIVKKEPSYKIRLVYWGMIRQVEFNKRVCDCFGNDSRIELVYHGEGQDKELKKYCEDNGIQHVKFTGRYTVDQIEEFVGNTDILINLYENDGQQKLATTVKLYDGIRYGLPMLITKDSHMAKLMNGNSAVFQVDMEKVNVGDLVSWYYGLDKSIYPYEQELKKIKENDKQFESKLLDFVRR